MQMIGSIDTAVFYAINHLPHGWFSDGFFSIVSGLGDAGFIWFVIGIWLIYREETREKRFLLPLGIAGIAAWFMSEVLLKFIVTRLRPSNTLDDVIVVGFPNGYSFPSTHATFAFALAVVLATKEPKFKAYFFGLAVLVGFSRIYLGYHYPGDVLAGAGIGYVIGYIVMVWYAQRKAKNLQRIKKRSARTMSRDIFKKKRRRSR